MENNTVGGRIKESFKLIFSNFNKYLTYNLAVWLISLVLSFIFIGIGVYLVYLKLSVVVVTLSVVLILLGLWLISAFSWLINYFLTKKLLYKEKFSLSKAIHFCFKNLRNKALVDLWYFIVILFVIILAIIFSLFVFFIPYSVRDIFALFISLFGLLSLAYVFMRYLFSYYYCFDNKNFSWKSFLNSANIVKGKFWVVLGNFLIAFIIGYLISLLIQLAGNSILMILSHGVDFNQLLQNFVFNLNRGIKPDFVLLSLLAGYLIVISLGKSFGAVYLVVYTYIYYTFLKKEENQDNE